MWHVLKAASMGYSSAHFRFHVKINIKKIEKKKKGEWLWFSLFVF